jgi:hypothetical protein
MKKLYTARFLEFCRVFGTSPEELNVEARTNPRTTVFFEGEDVAWNAAFVSWVMQMWTKFDPSLEPGFRTHRNAEFDAFLALQPRRRGKYDYFPMIINPRWTVRDHARQYEHRKALSDCMNATSLIFLQREERNKTSADPEE